MKHLINILNVFLAIYACRAMGCFGVPLIFHWRRGTVREARVVGSCIGCPMSEQPWTLKERCLFPSQDPYPEFLIFPFNAHGGQHE